MLSCIESVPGRYPYSENHCDLSEIGFFRKYRATPVRDGRQVTSNLRLICVHLCSSLRPLPFLFYVRTIRASCVRSQFSFPGVTARMAVKAFVSQNPLQPLTAAKIQIMRNRNPANCADCAQFCTTPNRAPSPVTPLTLTNKPPYRKLASSENIAQRRCEMGGKSPQIFDLSAFICVHPCGPYLFSFTSVQSAPAVFGLNFHFLG